jgi:hypothetical protein
MQLLHIFNASNRTIFPVGTSQVLAGAAREVAVPQVDFDPQFFAYLEKAPLMGIGFTGAGGELTTDPVALGIITALQQVFTVTGTVADASRMVIADTASGAYAIDLPAAADVPEGDTIFVFNDARVGTNTLTVNPDGTNTIEGTATLTRSAVVFAALSGVPATVTVALTAGVGTPNGIHSIDEVAGVSTVITADFASGNVSAQDVVDAITAGTGVTAVFAGSVNVSATTAAPATVVAAAAAAPLVPGTVALTAAANTLRFVSDGVSNWTTY